MNLRGFFLYLNVDLQILCILKMGTNYEKTRHLTYFHFRSKSYDDITDEEGDKLNSEGPMKGDILK
jgi:hypothetical protein